MPRNSGRSSRGAGDGAEPPDDGPAPVNANSRQVGGGHYKTEHGLEHWDVVAMFGLDYFQGQITKYVMRHRKKNGIQDLEKARHFLDKYIELERARLTANANNGEAQQGA